VCARATHSQKSALQFIFTANSGVSCLSSLESVENSQTSVCCSVLQRVAVCCSVMQCDAVFYLSKVSRILKRQCVAACCSVLQRLAV